MNDRLQRLRRDLTEAVAPPTCPTGYRVRTFAADDAPTVHRLLEVGYAQGGGHIGAFEEWWPSLRDDDEFAPDLCFLAVNERQDIVGVAQCWTSGPILTFASVSAAHFANVIIKGPLANIRY
jgi:hypothetical protein